MKLDGPIGPTLLDDGSGIIGAPMDRVDGRLKVTGGAKYSYEWPHEGALYGYVVQSEAASGRIKTLDTGAAEKMPGVRLVLTYKSAPPQQSGDQPQRHRLAGPRTTEERDDAGLVTEGDIERKTRHALAEIDIDHGKMSIIRGRDAARRRSATGRRP